MSLCSFVHTFDSSLAKSYDMAPDTVAVFQPEVFWSPHEEGTLRLTDPSATYADIVRFVRRAAVPLVGQRTKSNLFKYSDRPLVVVYYSVNFDPLYVKVDFFLVFFSCCSHGSQLFFFFS